MMYNFFCCRIAFDLCWMNAKGISDQQLLFIGPEFCWHLNICPINCILSLCQLLIRAANWNHKITESIQTIIPHNEHQFSRWRRPKPLTIIFNNKTNQMCLATSSYQQQCLVAHFTHLLLRNFSSADHR